MVATAAPRTKASPWWVLVHARSWGRQETQARALGYSVVSIWLLSAAMSSCCFTFFSHSSQFQTRIGLLLTFLLYQLRSLPFHHTLQFPRFDICLPMFWWVFYLSEFQVLVLVLQSFDCFFWSVFCPFQAVQHPNDTELLRSIHLPVLWFWFFSTFLSCKICWVFCFCNAATIVNRLVIIGFQAAFWVANCNTYGPWTTTLADSSQRSARSFCLIDFNSNCHICSLLSVTKFLTQPANPLRSTFYICLWQGAFLLSEMSLDNVPLVEGSQSINM